nr:uncharacterized protein LOC128697302 [Cherax quadricarinatus]
MTLVLEEDDTGDSGSQPFTVTPLLLQEDHTGDSGSQPFTVTPPCYRKITLVTVVVNLSLDKSLSLSLSLSPPQASFPNLTLHHRQASVLAVTATAAAVVVIIVEIFAGQESIPDHPRYPNPTVSSFSLGFGSILFAYGGAAVFPTIQNDMEDRSLFWKSIYIGFTGIQTMYLPVALSGYIMYGDQVKDNILLTVDSSAAVTVAIALQIVNLLCTFIISCNPVSQTIEDVLNIPHNFNWRRCVVRSVTVLLQMLICLAIPDFGLILNLIGGSLITLCTFVLPPLMYMRLIDDHSGPWKHRTMAMWERIFLGRSL